MSVFYFLSQMFAMQNVFHLDVVLSTRRLNLTWYTSIAATSSFDETSLHRSLSVLERGKLKSPPTLMLSLGNCSSILDLCLRKSLAGKSRDHRWKTFRLKIFTFTLKQKAGVFRFLPFEDCFWKVPLSWWISVDGKPNSKSKAVFLKSSGVV